MISNLFYTFKTAPALVRKSLLSELLHGLLVAVPTGFLLLIIQELFSGNPVAQRIWLYVIIMVVLLGVQLWLAAKTMIGTNVMAYTLSTNLRIKLGDHLQRLSMGTFKQRDPGDLAAVVLQDVANFEMIFAHTIGNIAGAVFATLIISVFLFITDWRLALVLLCALPLSWVMIRISNYLIVQQGSKHVAARNETSARFLEYVQGIRHIKSFGMTGKRFTSLETALNDFRRASIRTEAIPGPFVLVAGLALEVFFLLMIYLAVTFLTNGSLTPAAVITFLIVGYRLYEPIKIVLVDYVILRYMNISLDRVIEVLRTPEQSAGKGYVPAGFNISFEQVTFGYQDDKAVLQNVSFEVPERSMLALVGPSGSGKTTITALMARFWDVQSGSVKIGGTDVKEMDPSRVYSLISEVFQDVYLFDDTIYNNIRFGRMDATDEEVRDAAARAMVLDFAWDLPEGLHARTGEGGNKLSGGQKQRISIARALLKNAPIVLLDEATASLDPENEIYIQQAIRELVKDKTVVVVAHKLATIRHAEQILVLQEGCIAETGTHTQLMEKKGLYHHLWEIQQQSGGWKITGNRSAVVSVHDTVPIVK
ncbi:ABC transporter ATP-binding protein [Chitinophaga nivalis]|uniref:ABC transporter ATP-binding protein/permease n=1 Tax=Chitinophaga nivalis TaxID=2991709 RepID=A0ABT3ITZ0_9BACT|nr:ABC transporter ATP-binding protein [Chitinophaga nivalis]MCW3463146.1 ABC transporter ATP-binding protein/permease [Chitinophaga nivalis]MCW3487164.1 ABC transporter ATP-binding protein/permease [Chitinophaga nivalis]